MAQELPENLVKAGEFTNKSAVALDFQRLWKLITFTSM